MIHKYYDIRDIPEYLKPYHMLLCHAEEAYEEIKPKSYLDWPIDEKGRRALSIANMMRHIAQSAWYSACDMYMELMRLDIKNAEKWALTPIVRSGIYWESARTTITSGIVYRAVLDSDELKAHAATPEYKAWQEVLYKTLDLETELRTLRHKEKELTRDMQATPEYETYKKFSKDYHEMMIRKGQKGDE